MRALANANNGERGASGARRFARLPRAHYSSPCIALTGCISQDITDENDDVGDADLVNTSSTVSAYALIHGVNSGYCTASPFNCRFRSGSSRVDTQGGDETWGIEPGAMIRDGNGAERHVESGSQLTFNYGQSRAIDGKAYALAMSTSNASAGWFPVDHISGETSFRQQVGNVDAKDPGKGPMACYEIKSSADETLAAKKVVKGSTDTNERAGDYLSLVRANNKRSANLVFSVPGFALGGATTDRGNQVPSGDGADVEWLALDLDPAVEREIADHARWHAALLLRLCPHDRRPEPVRLDGAGRAADLDRLSLSACSAPRRACCQSRSATTGAGRSRSRSTHPSRSRWSARCP